MKSTDLRVGAEYEARRGGVHKLLAIFGRGRNRKVHVTPPVVYPNPPFRAVVRFHHLPIKLFAGVVRREVKPPDTKEK